MAGKSGQRASTTRYELRASDVLLADEDQEAFENLRASLHRELQPEGELMGAWVDEITLLLWRLRRCGRLEAAIYGYQLECAQGALASSQGQDQRWCDGQMVWRDPGGAQTLRPGGSKSTARKNQATLGLAAVLDATSGDSLGNLSRYEQRLRRQLDRALAVYWHLRWQIPVEREPAVRSHEDEEF